MKRLAVLGLCAVAAIAWADVPAETPPPAATPDSPETVSTTALDDVPTGDVPSDTVPATPAILAGAPYTAETYPIERIHRPVTLVPGMIELNSRFGVDLSKGVAGKQLSFGADLAYGVVPLFDLGVNLATLDIRSFTSELQAGFYARRQILDFAAVRGDLELLREPGTGSGRLTARAGIPFRVWFSHFALEGLDHVVALRTATRGVGLTIPLSLITQLGQVTYLDLHGEPGWATLSAPRFALPLSLTLGLAFSNASELGIAFRLLDARTSLDGRDLGITLLLRF